MRPAGPAVEVAGDPHALRRRRPDREAGAADAPVRGVVGADVGAQGVPQPLVAALADQVQVDLAERGQPAVRVVHRVDVVAVADLQAVVAGRLGNHAGPQPGVVHPHQRPCPLGVTADEHQHLVGVRPQRAHHGAVAVRMRAQHAVRVVVGSAQHVVDRALVGRAGVDRLGLLFALHGRTLLRSSRPRCTWLRSAGARIPGRQPLAARARAMRNAARSSTRSRRISTTRVSSTFAYP